jgi:hypothetical protein
MAVNLLLLARATLPNSYRLPHVREVEYSRGNDEAILHLLCRHLFA